MARPNQGRDLDYSTMPVPEIFRLLDSEILPQAAPVHSVFLWGVDQFLATGEAEMLSRGYRIHARLIWDKGNGIAPAFSVRYSHEYVTWFYRPSFTPVSLAARGRFTTVIREPAREHSRKPDSLYDMLEALYPQAVKMDVFSREPRNGWLQFGDQTSFFAPEESASK